MKSTWLIFGAALVIATSQCWASPLQTLFSSELKTRSEISVMNILREREGNVITQDSALDMSALEQALVEMTLTDGNLTTQEDKMSCQCGSNTCQCCVKLKVKKIIHFSATVCASIEFLPRELAIQASLTFNGQVFWQKKVSGQNPPPICVPVVHVKAATICIKFHDLSFKDKKPSGCMELSVKVGKIKVFKVDKCFHASLDGDASEHLGKEQATPEQTDTSSMQTIDLSEDVVKAILEHPDVIQMLQKALDGFVLTDGGMTDLPNQASCQCQGYTCGCCLRIKIHKIFIHLDLQVCIHVRYLPQQLGVSIDLTCNGKVLFQKTISAKNPPDICVPIPEVPIARICVKLSNLDFESHKFSGCIDLSVKALHVTVFKVHLGCFRIPPNGQELTSVLNQNQDVELPSVSASPQSALLFTTEDEDKDQSVQKLFQTFVQTDMDLEKNSICACEDGKCTCCFRLVETSTTLEDAVCADFRYLQEEEKVDVILTVNDKPVIDDQALVSKPAPVCVSTGDDQKLASLCLQLNNLDVQDLGFSGCVDLEAGLVGMVIKKRAIGCFQTFRSTVTAM